MKAINDSSKKTSRIVRVMGEIDFQIDMLMLNAAVEGAMAGEGGIGFAAVAGEVRNLAHRNAPAAQDTAALTEESIANSNEGTAKLQFVASSQQVPGSAKVAPAAMASPSHGWGAFPPDDNEGNF